MFEYISYLSLHQIEKIFLMIFLAFYFIYLSLRGPEKLKIPYGEFLTLQIMSGVSLLTIISKF
ncbi:hypothetical protein [Methanococcus maripaludis]|uniref:Uncharacterized protein n=1 Tax=Methanococcus maripaludis TaxID=39152 RepID=A0A7J9PLP8_METMI|nr:hypothetical protein [Methanococcus maripaludis]MBA2864021.1 hypothetical protein [Methanococcus maripaludis]